MELTSTKILSMKRLFVLTLFTLLVGTIIQVTAQEKKIIGDWKYQVSSAPYGYESGTITFSKDEANLKGAIKFYGGYEVKLQNPSFKNDTLRAGAFVEGENIKITALYKEDKLEGKVDTSMGVMPISAVKNEAKNSQK